MFLPGGLKGGFRDHIAFLFRLLAGSDFQIALQENVAFGIVFVHDLRVLFQGLVHVEYPRQRLVFDCDEVEGSGEDAPVFGQHQGHSVAAMPHFVVNQHWLIFSDHTLSVGSRDMLMSEHAQDAGKPLRVTCVNAFHTGMRNTRSFCPGPHEFCAIIVCSVPRPAGNFFVRVSTRRGSTDAQSSGASRVIDGKVRVLNGCKGVLLHLSRILLRGPP